MRYCFVLAFLVCIVVTACQKIEAGPARKFISLQVDGQIILVENPKAVLSAADLTDSNPDNDYPTITISGKSDNDEDIIFTLISESEPFKTGTYVSSQRGNGMSVFYSDSAYALVADDTNGYLSLEITKAQDSLFEAHFAGLVADTTGVIPIKPVTSGFLRAVLTRN